MPARSRRRQDADADRVDLAPRRGSQDSAEPSRTHQPLTVGAGRVDPPLTPSRHEAVLVELSPVADETPLWWDERRPPGREAA